MFHYMLGRYAIFFGVSVGGLGLFVILVAFIKYLVIISKNLRKCLVDYNIRSVI